ncbi:hypothetical protein [Nesterenkonia muleiensis]|uniref:hypothetical protein n=1 Tax=Nesterenkonia muleiensis TaxID=2282648 RepID=UPI000E71352A|nr:hypothetical protein [Nesterenkonia muleiensis]
MKEHQPHHEHHDDEPRAEAARWRASPQGQLLRAEIVEHMGSASEREPSQLAIDTIRALMSTCLSSHQEQLPISTEDAHMIAMLLSTAATSDESHLADFADGKGMLPGSMREEIAGILDRRHIYPEMREAANWLGNYMLGEEGYDDFLPKPGDGFPEMDHVITQNPSHGMPAIAFHHRKARPGEDAEQMREAAANRAEEIILEHGFPGFAYLRRPSVDVLAEDLQERMDTEYIGSRRHPHRFTDEVALADRLHRDDPLVRQALAENYELVWAGREVHLFRRHEVATGEDARTEDGHGK